MNGACERCGQHWAAGCTCKEPEGAAEPPTLKIDRAFIPFAPPDAARCDQCGWGSPYLNAIGASCYHAPKRSEWDGWAGPCNGTMVAVYPATVACAVPGCANEDGTDDYEIRHGKPVCRECLDALDYKWRLLAVRRLAC